MTRIIAKPIYTAHVSATGGRAGRATSSDGILDLELSRPGDGKATNPEQLLAAGWSACFQSAMAATFRREIDTSASLVTVDVTLGNEEDGSYALAAVIQVAIPDLPLERVQELADITHTVCPYSKATAGNIEVTVRAVPVASGS